MLTMLLPVAALADGEEAAVAPAAEQTAEVNTEDSAEPPAAGTSKEIVDVPTLGESADDADDTVVAESKGETDGEYEDEIVPNDSAAEDNSDETITAETMASTNEMAAALTLEGEGNAEAQTYYLSCRASNGTTTVTVNGEPIEFDDQVPAGATVKIVTTGDEGYVRLKADMIYVIGNGPSAQYMKLDAVESPAGTFTFTMPAYRVDAQFYFFTDAAAKLTHHVTMSDGTEETWTEYATKDVPYWVTMEKAQWVYLAESERISGWTLGSPTGEKLSEGYYVFTEDTDLYAVVEDGVKITFHYPDHEYSYYVAKNEKTHLPTTQWIDERDGKYAIGWSTNPDGSGTVYYDDTSPEYDSSNTGYAFSRDTDFYLTYREPVTVRCYGGENLIGSEKIGKGGQYTLPDRVGKSDLIQYWLVGSADSETRYLPWQRVQINDDTDLYAVFAEGEISLRFHDGNQVTASGIYPKNAEITIDVRLDGPSVPKDQAFLGWSLEPDGELLGQTVRFSEDTTLYAKFAPAVLVVYDPNGGECNERYGGRYSRAVGSYLTNFTAADNFVTREGYTLKGWSLSKDGIELYDFSKPITGHTTLYAVWEGASADVVISDTNNSGVTVTLPNGTQVEGVALVAVPLTGEDNSVALAVLGKQLGQTAGKSYVLDIYFTKAGEEVSVKGRRTVTVPIPENWNAANTAVYYIDPENGTVQNMNGVVSADGKTISFVTDHFSYYALVEVKAADADPTPDPTPAPTPAASAAPTTAPTSSGAQSPKTGDEANLALWLLLATVSAVGLGYVCMKKKEER